MDTDASVRIQPVGGSTAIIEFAGLRLITDPTLDALTEPADGLPRRMTPPALTPEALGRFDVALVSHDQHPDNLDAGGRALLAEIPLVVTTTEGAARLGGTARGLAPFESLDVDAPDGAPVRVTALPAQHGPHGAEALLGPVVGFLLSGAGRPTVYVSGDNASVDVVREIAAQVGPVDTALLFAGGASSPRYFDGALLTLGNAEAVEAARVLEARAVVPIHCEGWTHYSQGRAGLTRAFADAGLAHVLVTVPDGATVSL
jgi:L-ascorbate metabolism protein UlaG (beta-lactamase superfamily)